MIFNIQGNFFLHQTELYNWMLTAAVIWTVKISIITRCHPLSGPSPVFVSAWSGLIETQVPMCTGAGVWSSQGPTVHHCTRVSLGVRTRHNCSHCISAALCVIINCPHNNWRFVILARISHSLSSFQTWRQRRCNNHSSVGWKEKYGLKSRVFNSFTRISGEHEAALSGKTIKNRAGLRSQDCYSCVPWALLSETSFQDLAHLLSVTDISSVIVSINHNLEQISRGHSLASDNEWSQGVNQGGVDLCCPEIDVTSNKQTLRHGALHRDTGTRPDASALEDSLFVAEFFAARCPLRAAFVRDIICKKVDFLGKINFTRGKPAKTGHWTSGTARLSLERYLQEGPCNSIIRCHSIQVGPLLPLVLSPLWMLHKLLWATRCQ